MVREEGPPMSETEFVLSTVDGELVIFTAGRGETVVLLTGSRPDDVTLDSSAAGQTILTPGIGAGQFGILAAALAETRQVFSLSPSRRVGADALITSLRRHGIEQMSLIGFAADTEIALEVAAKSPDAVNRLVLISPARTSFRHLEHIAAPTLIMVGTNDISSSADTARAIRAGISNSNLSFVYDASSNIVKDRPSVCHATVEDFLQRGGAYVVRRGTMAAHP